ncbi:hypothetical protein LEQ41_05755 [Streptococcus agalactiae]|nr:hypothetical protein [Streptococcus agalactiae]
MYYFYSTIVLPLEIFFHFSMIRATLSYSSSWYLPKLLHQYLLIEIIYLF